MPGKYMILREAVATRVLAYGVRMGCLVLIIGIEEGGGLWSC